MKRLFGLLFLVGLLVMGGWSARYYSRLRQVERFRPMVQEVLADLRHQEDAAATAQQVLLDEDLILAVIYTETKGALPDVMQVSESVTGQQDSILDQQESIRLGASLLSENLDKAQQLGIDAWSAVQAYNFGQAYLDHVAQHGGRSTVDLARAYSRDLVAPSLGNTTGQTYPYYHPIALWYGGSSLYSNGGNSYYAKEVALTYWLIKQLKALQVLDALGLQFVKEHPEPIKALF